MIPSLYEKDETAFLDNGLGRLRDCVSCVVTEERNGIYECDFEYPVTGQNFDEIQIGRIVGVTHDDSGDVQPFDIVGYTKPIEGVVTFHCTHISYRQSYMTANGTNITSLFDAFAALQNAQPSNPFTYWTNNYSTGYVGAFDGVPKSVRSILGGVEGSILDAYGGEYEWDKFTVKRWTQRGEYRDFTIRYGVNMMDYQDETDATNCYSSIIPYWTDGTTTVVGDKQTLAYFPPSGRDACIPMDVSEKIDTSDGTIPTKAQVEAEGLAMLNSGLHYLPAQTIKVSFVRLQDTGEFEEFANLLRCGLCDTIRVIFPDYKSSGYFKIVKTVWDVLGERYEEMELGDLSISLSQALGINDIQKDSRTTIEQITDRLDDIVDHIDDIDDYIVEQGTSGIWTYRKWYSGLYDAWYVGNINLVAGTAWLNGAYYHLSSSALTPPSFSTSVTDLVGACNSAVLCMYAGHDADYKTYWVNGSSGALNNVPVRLDVHGRWK